MKTSKITLIAKNAQGASVEYKGETKAEALRNLKAEYNTKGWKIEYFDETGNKI
jgi:hypothetical protein